LTACVSVTAVHRPADSENVPRPPQIPERPPITVAVHHSGDGKSQPPSEKILDGLSERHNGLNHSFSEKQFPFTSTSLSGPVAAACHGRPHVDEASLLGHNTNPSWCVDVSAPYCLWCYAQVPARIGFAPADPHRSIAFQYHSSWANFPEITAAYAGTEYTPPNTAIASKKHFSHSVSGQSF
jgi:hypothetical protein